MSEQVKGFYDENAQAEWDRLDRPGYRHELITTLRLISRHFPASSRVADVGAGPGRYTVELLQRGYRVTLVELSPEQVDLARQKIAERGLSAEQLLCADARDLKMLAPESFDAAMMLGPLYHLDHEADRRAALGQLFRILKPGGVAIVAYLNAWGVVRVGLTDFPTRFRDPEFGWRTLAGGPFDASKLGFTQAFLSTPPHAQEELATAGFELLTTAGCEGFASGMHAALEKISEADPVALENVLQLASRTSELPQFRDTGEHLHLVIRKPGPITRAAPGTGGDEPLPDSSVQRESSSARDTQRAEAVTIPPPAQAQVGAPAPLARGSELGRYVILDRLAEGGMGVVYAAYDPVLNRRVALKLLRAEETKSSHAAEGRARLLREAQAMARLSHPNVVSVHDMGMVGDTAFVALELVEGTTLSGWIKAKQPPWRQVLKLFREAGKGLAAAHDAGLIHRDFKPNNVLVRHDGRVQVADFGLVRALGSTETDVPMPDVPLTESPADALQNPITQAGVVMGTLGYMAPEQCFGHVPDARTDQFSFCVALYEALYGQRPFPSSQGREAYMKAVHAGELRDPPGARVPGWVRKILLKGLSGKPEDRYPSMQALLQALSRDPRLLQRRALASVAAVAVVGVLAFNQVQAARARSQQCSDIPQRLVGVWDDERHHAMQERFLASGYPGARQALDYTEQLLDCYAQEWVTMSTEACQATRIREAQPEAVLVLRMGCLGSRLGELDALTRLLVGADQQVVERAADAANALTPLAGCADAEALARGTPPPRDTAAREKVQKLRARLAEAKALADTAKHAESTAIVQQVLAEARAVGYLPLEAEALETLGRQQWWVGDSKGAESTLREAVLAAEASRHDETLAQAYISLVMVVGRALARFDEGHALARHAHAVIQRLGGNERLEAALLNRSGLLYRDEGRYAEAEAELRKALELGRHAWGPEHPELVRLEVDLATALQGEAKFEEARAHILAGLALSEKVRGPDHPDTARVQLNLGNTLISLKDFAGAREHLTLALKKMEASLGPDHTNTIGTLETLGQLYLATGENEQARTALERVLAHRLKMRGPDHPTTGLALAGLARAAAHQGQFQASLDYAQRAVAIWQKALPADHPNLALGLTELGQAYLGLGAAPKAVAPLERAVELGAARHIGQDDLGAARFALARALWDAKKDRPRAVQLATQALEDFQAAKEDTGEKAVDAWLAAHRRGR